MKINNEKISNENTLESLIFYRLKILFLNFVANDAQRLKEIKNKNVLFFEFKLFLFTAEVKWNHWSQNR